MKLFKVYSPVMDEKIKDHLNDSPIWKKAYHEDDIAQAKVENNRLYEYTVKFDGLKPIFVTNFKQVQ